MEKGFRKDYHVAIDTVPLPEKPDDRIKVIVNSINPVISEIFNDAMTVAIDSVPLPEKPVNRLQTVTKFINPIFNQIMNDAMTVAIGTWPTPERPGLKRRV